MSKFNPEIILLFPPGWSTSAPYLSVPLLSSLLEDNNIKNKGIDLNIRIINMILTDSNLERTVEWINKILLSKKIKEEHRIELLIAKDLYSVIKGSVDNNISKLRSNNISVDERVSINKLIDTAYRIHSAPYFPGIINNGMLVYTSREPYSNRLDFSDFEITNTLSDLEIKIENENTNPFSYHIKKYCEELYIGKLKMIGLSICGYSQLITSLFIAKTIKKRNPGLKIVLGGAIMPYILSALKENPFPFKYIDFIIYGPGEDALLKLYDHINGRININDIPGLIYYDWKQAKLVQNGKVAIVDINQLKVPIFDKEELKSYLIPYSDIALPILGSRGCYWGKCAFCGINCSYDNKFQRKRVDLIVDDMELLENHYKINRYRLIDNCIHPSTLNDISKEILKRNNIFLWQCMARFEDGFNLELWHQLYKSGLRLVSFGLESPNQFILDKMNKGVPASSIPRILNQCQRAGIFTHCFFIIGFPGEQNISPDELIEFIILHRYLIDSFTITKYRLESQSNVFNNRKEYEIELKKSYPKDYIKTTYEHKDFCNAEERVLYVNSNIANLECSQIGFIGLDDMLVIGSVLKNKKTEIKRWNKRNTTTYTYLMRMVSEKTIHEVEFSSIEFVNKNKYYIIFKNKINYNYYIFKNNKIDEQSISICKHLEYDSKQSIEYLYDIIFGMLKKKTNFEV